MYRIGQEEIDEVAKVIESKQLFKINDGFGQVKHAEQRMCEIFNSKYALMMTSGHAGLASALVALGVGPGDEVIVPAYTYIATAIAVLETGAIPVIAEVDETLTLCPIDTEKKISKHTKAIVPVHIQGFPCDMDKIMALAEKYGLYVVEDACQADGGSYKGKRLGSIGNSGAFSFNYFKIVTAGEGGALITNDKTLYERALIYHDSSAIAYFGEQLSGVETEQFCGSEYRANEISAAVLRMQLEKMDGILRDLRKNKKYVMDELNGVAKFIPSNDIEGDCGTTLAFVFDSESQARAFSTAEGVNGSLPIDTGKHVYKNWTPVMQKRGAFNPLMDPFKMEANKDIVPAYTDDMCPKTLDLLSRVVYVSVNPDWTKEEIDNELAVLKKALSNA
ncbi:MAG: DegT/DnrJ/EryC1/StrS family aminotransferase [Clostridia bacterium]|nr:DegT/DnrJ/EryC1/StrS family aminotransferase [Clostridia bacterium]